MKRRWLGLAGMAVVLGIALGATTYSGWKPTPGSTTVWTLPASDSNGIWQSNGSAQTSIGAAVTSYVNVQNGTVRLPETVVGSLPSAASNTGKVYVVTDGTSTSDCVTGSGSTPSLCRSNGSAWVALGGGAGGSGDITGVGDCTSGQCDTIGALRINPRVVAASDATSITPTGDTADITTQVNTQSTGTLTVNAPTGTPVNGQLWELRIKATNVQTFAWNAIYRGQTGLPLPTVSNSGASGIDYYLFQYHSGDSTWDFLAVTSDAYSTGIILIVSQGGTGSAPASGDQVLVSDSTVAATWRSVPDCTDASGQHLNYTASTNAFSCGTTGAGGTGSLEGATMTRAATQTIATSTDTKVQWDTTISNDNAYWNSGANTKFTVPATGFYMICYTVTWDTGGRRFVEIFVNGALRWGNEYATSSQEQSICGLDHLSASDYVEFNVWQNSGGNRTITARGSILRGK